MMKLSYGIPIVLLGAAVVIVQPQIAKTLSLEDAKPPQSRTSQLPQPKSPLLLVSDPKGLIAEVWAIIHRQYVDGTFNHQDWQAVGREYLSKSYSNKQEAYKSIRECQEIKQ